MGSKELNTNERYICRLHECFLVESLPKKVEERKNHHWMCVIYTVNNYSPL